MEVIAQKRSLRSLILSMLEEGMVNDHFQQLQALKETVRRDYVIREIITYCNSVKCLFIHLTDHIKQSNVDYYQVNSSAHDLYEKSRRLGNNILVVKAVMLPDHKIICCIGAEQVRIACAELINATEENDPDHSYRALYWVKNEFSKLLQKFEVLVKILLLKQKPATHNSRYRGMEDYMYGLLQDYVQSLFDKGIVNKQFSHLLTLKTEDKSDSVVKLISSYLDDVEAMLLDFAEDMDPLEVDFKRLASQARKIADRSSGIGAEHMRLACSDLIKACDEMQGKKFLQAVSWTKIEFARTRNKLEPFIQMEKRIMRLKGKSNKPANSGDVSV